MLNLLIAHKNLKKIQELQNYVSIYLPNVRVSFVAVDGKSAIKALNKHHFDIVLLDFELPILDGFDITAKISKARKESYKDSFVVVTDNPFILSKLKSEYFIYEALPKTASVSEVVNKVAKLMFAKKDAIHDSEYRTKIITELQHIGYNLSHQGTHYIAESIFHLHKNYSHGENLSKSIYPMLCEKYDKTLNTVKCNITSATDSVYKTSSPNELQQYFKLTGDIKPTAKMVINTVLQKI